MSDMATWTEGWQERFSNAMREQEAASFFRPAKEIAHFQAMKTGHTITSQVWWDDVNQWSWSTTLMVLFDDVPVMHTMRSGYEKTREACCLAAYNAAKELARAE